MVLVLWLILGMMIVGRFVKKTTALYNASTQAQDTLNQYAQILNAIESESFASQFLKEQSAKIYSENNSASSKLKVLTKNINYLGNRNNIFLTPIINGFFLWDIIFGRKIEDWIIQNSNSVKQWFEVIEYFDSQNSLASLC